MKRYSFRQNIIYSQIILYLSFLICALLAPASLSANSGLSYFGVHPLTIIPFGAGMLISAFLIFTASAKNKRGINAVIGNALKLIALLMVGVVFTPYSVGSWVDYIHTAFGASVFCLQLALAFWLSAKSGWRWRDLTLLVIQIAGGVIALIYLAPPQGFLLQGQIIFQLAFSGILLGSLPILAGRASKT